MTINYIYIKRMLIVSLGLLAGYALFSLLSIVLAKPSNIDLNLSPIIGSSFDLVVEENIAKSSTAVEFNYQLIGYRAGESRASVIVEKGNQTFVVQQGDLLENKYKLISVNSELAIFTQNGKSYQLSTNLQLDN
tara:strand:+ start:286 stop:687 length:402 start_codon:yes stop_codon:yes gene_type:complete